MRLGIRLQLLLALGSLLVLAFLPLFFAVASLTRASLEQVREASAASLGRAVAGHVTAREARGGDLSALLDAQIGPEGVAAVGVYDAEGALLAERGEEGMAPALPRAVAPGVERSAKVQTSRGRRAARGRAGRRRRGGGRRGPDRPRDHPEAALVRLFALYTGIVALALLVFAYISMTRLVVQPIDGLSRSAKRVAEGARGSRRRGRGRAS